MGGEQTITPALQVIVLVSEHDVNCLLSLHGHLCRVVGFNVCQREFYQVIRRVVSVSEAIHMKGTFGPQETRLRVYDFGHVSLHIDGVRPSSLQRSLFMGRSLHGLIQHGIRSRSLCYKRERWELAQGHT
jgi:hypothetical protein